MKSPAPLTHPIPPHGKNIPAVVKGERRMAFAPEPLSSLPAPDWGRLVPALGNASRAVGALRSIRNLLPNSDYFLEGCVKREALYSSQVEGTQSSLDDLLLDEDGQRKPADGGNSPDDDRAETSNYVTALKSGLDHLRGDAPDSLPLSLRLLRNLHQTLLQSGRGPIKARENSGAAKTGLAIISTSRRRRIKRHNAWRNWKHSSSSRTARSTTR